jgi:hypothetical protein
MVWSRSLGSSVPSTVKADPAEKALAAAAWKLPALMVVVPV